MQNQITPSEIKGTLVKSCHPVGYLSAAALDGVRLKSSLSSRDGGKRRVFPVRKEVIES